MRKEGKKQTKEGGVNTNAEEREKKQRNGKERKGREGKERKVPHHEPLTLHAIVSVASRSTPLPSLMGRGLALNGSKPTGSSAVSPNGHLEQSSPSSSRVRVWYLQRQRQAKEREKGKRERKEKAKESKGKERKGKRERKEKGKRKEWRMMHVCQRIQRRAKEYKGRGRRGRRGSACACVRVCVCALSFTWTYTLKNLLTASLACCAATTFVLSSGAASFCASLCASRSKLSRVLPYEYESRGLRRR